MALSDCQKQVDEWVQQYKIPYWTPHEIVARLAEEVGEIAKEVNHQFGPKRKKAGEKQSSLGDELADVIFTVCCMANSQGINLDDAFQQAMDKYYGRDKDRFEKKKND